MDRPDKVKEPRTGTIWTRVTPATFGTPRMWISMRHTAGGALPERRLFQSALAERGIETVGRRALVSRHGFPDRSRRARAGRR
jgi:hypothetical protein